MSLDSFGMLIIISLKGFDPVRIGNVVKMYFYICGGNQIDRCQSVQFSLI
jgi:hypothetical protein